MFCNGTSIARFQSNPCRIVDIHARAGTALGVYVFTFLAIMFSCDNKKRAKLLKGMEQMGYDVCSLDIPFLHKRCSLASAVQNRKRRVCQRITQKRLLDHRSNKCKDDDAHVAYRNPLGRENPYVNCTFLDGNDVVVAANERGTIDIVRLPSCRWSEEPLRHCGKLLSQLCVSENARVHGNFERFKLHSIQKGNAFAVGDPFSGELRVYATENATIRWKLQTPQSNSFSTTRPVVPAGTNSHGFDHHLICKIRGPMRKYNGSCRFAPLSFQIEHSTSHVLTGPAEIDRWEEERFRRGENCAFNRKSNWDFRETPSGSLLALHVCAESDLLGIRILDERSSKICVAVDLDMEMNKQYKIANACFIDDKLVAYQCGSHDGCIKIWDIRMLKDSVQILPSYPKDSAFGFRTSSRISSNPSTYRRSGTDYPSNTKTIVIPDYSLTPLHCGNLIASSKRADLHTVLDPYRSIVVKAVDVSQPETTTSCNCFAVDQESGTIAVYDQSLKTIRVQPTSYSRDRPDRGMGKKRSHPDSISCNNNEIQANLYDAYGLETSLACLVYNESGTSLIGGSIDGDIFLWR
jgi:hypothetical protein